MFKQIAIAAALAVVASSASSDEWDASFFPSSYIGGDVGSTRLNGQTDRHNSYGVYVGYEFVPNFALEVGARRLGDFKACCARVKIDQAAVSVIGAVPLGNAFNVFARIGFNKLQTTSAAEHTAAESTSSSKGSLVGVGMGYTFSPTVWVRAEIQKPRNEMSNVSIGVSIKY